MGWTHALSTAAYLGGSAGCPDGDVADGVELAGLLEALAGPAYFATAARNGCDPGGGEIWPVRMVRNGTMRP